MMIDFMGIGIDIHTHLLWSPEAPLWMMIAGGTLALLLLGVSLYWRARGGGWRFLFVAGTLLLLSGPSVLETVRTPLPPVVGVVTDTSLSQSFEARAAQSAAALDALKSRFQGLSSPPEVRYAPAYFSGTGFTDPRTALFAAAERLFADVPPSRRAGLILITDGQVQDVPNIDKENGEDEGEGRNVAGSASPYGPVHAILTGDPAAFDRRVEILSAPAYGIAGKTVKVTFRVIDTPSEAKEGDVVSVRIRSEDGDVRFMNVRPGVPADVDIPVPHNGEIIAEIHAPPAPGELTARNNTRALRINGIRDRLKVLLVSGLPHNGGRTWRDLLTGDPGIDLVHFTILRQPQKIDPTPQNDMALIVFPINELFEKKLYDFDLIVFDRFQMMRILPQHYFENIARYVREGGGLLVVNGPAFADPARSLAEGPLGPILPGLPDPERNVVYTAEIQPRLTELGNIHPVTEILGNAGKSTGPWLRQVRVVPNPEISASDKGPQVLLRGEQKDPLLLLAHVGEGRIAQLTSDQIWLWRRHYLGGGPYPALMQRMVHWLMGEPALDENALEITQSGKTLRIRRRTAGLTEEKIDVRLCRPDDRAQTIPLLPLPEFSNMRGWVQGTAALDQDGLYRLEDPVTGKSRHIYAGDPDTPEYRDVVTTDAHLAPYVHHSGGEIFVYQKDGVPPVRLARSVRPGGIHNGVIDLRNAVTYRNDSVTRHPLLPFILWAFLLGGALLGGWLRESGRSCQTCRPYTLNLHR